MAAELRNRGISAQHYHADMGAAARSSVHTRCVSTINLTCGLFYQYVGSGMMGIFAHLLVYNVLRPESDTLRNFIIAGRLDSLENFKKRSID